MLSRICKIFTSHEVVTLKEQVKMQQTELLRLNSRIAVLQKALDNVEDLNDRYGFSLSYIMDIAYALEQSKSNNYHKIARDIREITDNI